MNKFNTRKHIKKNVEKMFYEDKNIESSLIMTHLMNSELYKNAEYISVYESIEDEVDTSYILNDKTKQIFTPKIMNEQDIIMTNKDGIICDFFDLIIVPGRAFDKKGNRLGRGKGYYDRFLLDKRCPSIGLAFNVQCLENIPVDDHDVSLSYVGTSSGIYPTYHPHN